MRRRALEGQNRAFEHQMKVSSHDIVQRLLQTLLHNLHLCRQYDHVLRMKQENEKRVSIFMKVVWFLWWIDANIEWRFWMKIRFAIYYRDIMARLWDDVQPKPLRFGARSHKGKFTIICVV